MLYAKLRSKLLCECTSRRFTFQVIWRRLWRKCVQVHTYLLGFTIFHMNRAQNSCLDSSARNCAENHSWIVWKIQARLRGYVHPSALENRRIRRTNVMLSVSSTVHIWRVFLANQLKNLISNTHMTGGEYLQVGCLSHLYQRENSWLCTWLYLCEVCVVSTWRYKCKKQSCVYMNVASSLAAKHH